MKKLLIIPIILILLFPSVLAVFTNSYFEGNGALSSITIDEGEFTNFTALAFSIDPPVTGTVSLVNGDGSITHTFDTFSENQGTYGSYFQIFDVLPTHYDSSCGTYTITTTGNDVVGGSAFTDITLNVVNCVLANTAPVVSGIPDVSFDEDGSDSSIDLDDYVTDDFTSDANIVWTVLGTTNVLAVIDVSTHVVTLTAIQNYNGQHTLTFTATDEGGLTASDDVVVTVNSVNDAPFLNPIGDRTATEGVAFFLTVFAVDVDGDTLTFSDDTALFDIDPATGEINFTPSFTDGGVYTVTVTVSDGSLTDSETITFTVLNVNRAPSVIITQPLDGSQRTEDTDNQYIALGTDPDDDALTYSWDFGNGNSATGDNVRYAHSDPGNYTITVTVSDGALNGTDSISLEIVPEGYRVENLQAFNDSQFSQPDDTYYRNEPLYVGFDVIDINSGNLTPGNINTVYIYNNNTGLGSIMLDAFNGNVGGVDIVDGEPATPDGSYFYFLANLPLSDDNLGWHIVFVFSFDGSSGGQAELPIQILNNPVIVSDIPDVSFDEDGSDSSIDLDDYVSDVETADADIVWTFSGNTNVNVAIDGTTHVVTFTAVQDFNGVETITFTADDTDGSTASDDVIVTVNPINDAPVVSGIPDVSMFENQSDSSIDLDAFVTDIDNTDAELTWTFSGNTNVAVVIGVGNVVTLTPVLGFTGAETITFTATDPDGLSDSDDSVVTVVAPPVNNTAPVVSGIPDVSMFENSSDSSIDLDSFVIDDFTSDANIVWSVSGNFSAVDVLIGAGNIVTFTPALGFTGTETFTFTATDEGGLSDSDTMDVVVNPVIGNNTAPVVSGIPDVTIVENGTDSSIDLDTYVSDDFTSDANMVWSFSGNTDVVVSIGVGNVVTLTPALSFTGVETIIFTATDEGGLSDSDDSIVTVVAGTSAPVVSGIPDVTMLVGATDSSIDLDDYVTDADHTDDQLTWNYTGNSVFGVSIDAVTHVVTFIPGGAQGFATITFTATDPTGLTGSDEMVLTVNPPNNPPVIDSFTPPTPVNINEFTTQLFTVNTSDADGDTLTYDWTLNGVSVSTSNSFSFFATPAATYTVIATVSDGLATVSQTWTVNVNATGGTSINVTGNFNPPTAATDVTFFNNCGTIHFDGPIDMSRILADFSLIDNGMILSCRPIAAVDASLLPELNDDATVTMFNAPDNFILYFESFFSGNWQKIVHPCPSGECSNVNFNSLLNHLSFDIDGFSSYTAREPTPVRDKSSGPSGFKDANIKIMKAKAASHLVRPGDYVDMLIGLYNDGDERADGLLLTVSNVELGFKQKFQVFDLRGGERKARFISFLIPEDTRPGEYYFRISASSDSDRRSKYVPIYVY